MGVDTPELGLCHSSDSREIKVNSKAGRLPRSILLKQFECVHIHVTSCMQNFVDIRLNNESYILKVRVSFEHMNGSLHGALHR